MFCELAETDVSPLEKDSESAMTKHTLVNSIGVYVRATQTEQQGRRFTPGQKER